MHACSIFMTIILVVLAALALATANPADAHGDAHLNEQVASGSAVVATDAVEASSEQDRVALVKFYWAVGGPQWFSGQGWLNGSDYCQWLGVGCNNGRVVSLRIRENGLSGTLPDALGNLTQLDSIDFSLNQQLSGTLPSLLFSNTAISQIRSIYAALESPLPETMFDRGEAITWIALGANHLSGTISHRWCELTRLQSMGLGFNAISGTLPSCITSMTSLQYLTMDSNHVSGTFPPGMEHLTRLVHVDFGGNLISGTLPWSAMLSWPALEMITLYELPVLQSMIPTHIPSWNNVTQLDLTSLNLRGDPSALFQLPQINTVLLGGRNILSGRLDTLLSFAPLVRQVALHAAFFGGSNFSPSFISGTIPENRGFSTLQIDGTRVSGTVPDTIWTGPTHYLGISGTKMSGTIPPRIDVASMYISMTSISGTFPWLSASGAVVIDLGFTDIHGHIEGTFPKLQILRTRHSQIGGSLPSNVLNSPNLQEVLMYNCGLRSIPSSIHSASLQQVALSNNLLSQEPPTLDCPSLQLLLLGGNRLTGTLPSDLFHKLPALKTLSIAGNSIGGYLPPLPDGHPLQLLSARHNQLRGLLPDSIMRSPILRSLDVSFNFLRGTIGDVKSMVSLEQIDLRSNQLNGRLNADLITLPNISSIHLQLNEFSCRFPDTWFAPRANALQSADVLLGSLLLCPLPELIHHLDTFSNSYECPLKIWEFLGYVSCGLLVLLLCTAFYFRRKTRSVDLSTMFQRDSNSRYMKYLRLDLVTNSVLPVIGAVVAVISLTSSSVYTCPASFTTSLIGVFDLSSPWGLMILMSLVLWMLLWWLHSVYMISDRSHTRSQTLEFLSWKDQTAYGMFVFAVLLVFGLLPNVLYVLALLSSNTSFMVKLFLRALLAVYKLLSTQLLIPKLCQRLRLLQSATDPTMAARHSARLITWTMLIVTLVAPVVSVLFVSPSCFYYEIVKPDPGVVAASYRSCTEFQLKTGICNKYGDSFLFENTPFQYRYEDSCPSQVATAYIPVFALSFLAQLGLQPALEVIRTLFRRPPFLLIDRLLLRLPTTLRTSFAIDSDLSSPVMIAQDITNLIIASVFGMLYPPLLLLSWLVSATNTKTRRLLYFYREEVNMISLTPELKWLPAVSFCIFISLHFSGNRLRHAPVTRWSFVVLPCQLLLFALLFTIYRWRKAKRSLYSPMQLRLLDDFDRQQSTSRVDT